MIDPAATPTASPLGTVLGAGFPSGAPAPAVGGNPADPAAFTNLLAAGEAAASTDAPAPARQDPVRQVLAALPAITAAGGKILPDLMPPPEEAARPVATPAGPPVPVLPLLRAVRPLEVAEPARPRVPAQVGDEAAPAADEPGEAAPIVVPALVFALAPAPAPTEAAAPAANITSGTVPAQPAPAALLLPPAIAAQLMGQALPRPVEPAQAQAAAARDNTRTLRLPAAPAPVAAEAQFTLASPAAPSGPASLRLRPVVEAPGPAPTESGTASPMPAMVADPAPIIPNAMAAGPAPAGVPALGHSFAAVVDRLMAAREAVQADGTAQPVAVNLRHAEFGTVSVRFEQRAEGLSVALASPDPDFARAVQAATPASSGNDAGFSGNASGNANGGGWTASSSGTGTQGQQGHRGTAAGQPERFAAPAANPRPDGGSPAAATDPRGIYA